MSFGATDPHDVERNWRQECLQSWHNALVNREPGSRDYVDYLGPYLKPSAFVDPVSTARFWLTEVDGDRVPLNRATGLAHFFQLEHKVGHGNPLDSLHACYLLDVDVFVTADRAFATTLDKLKTHLAHHADVLFVDRSSASTVDELSALRR